MESLISKINVLLLQVQSKHLQNAYFALRVRAFAVPSTAHRQKRAEILILFPCGNRNTEQKGLLGNSFTQTAEKLL